ncbi:hypothetical protein EDB84DRAFT_1443609 [Lactarius hengduanensis]|nr:hypothetical protein EDB84DRAFT_1443609 [Lactarius hengduanensis]
MEAAWMWRRGWGRGDGYEAGVVTWRGLPCWGGGVLRATLGRRGGSAVTGSWRGGAWRVGMVLRNVAGRRGGVLACRESADGGVLRSELSGVAGQGGVVRRRGAVWRVGGGKALRAVLGRHGDGLAVEVLRAVLRRRGGLAVARCWAETNGGGERARGGGNGLQRPGVAGWRWWRAASHVGAACSGGDEWRWRACTRGDNGLQRSVSSPPACAPTSTPRPASPDSPFQASLPSPLVVKTWQMTHWDDAHLDVAGHCHPLVHASPPQHATPTWLATRHHRQPAMPPQHGTQDKPLLPPRARESSPLVPAPARRPDMARDTPPPPPQHTQHPDHQPTTTPPQYGTQHPATANSPCCLNTTRNTPPTRLNAARKAQPPPTPTPPDTAHNTPPPANSPPPRPNTARQDPATSRKTPPRHARPRHITQDPADPPRRLNTARKAATTNPHATPTRRA